MDRPVVRQVPEGSGEQGKMEETGCENHLWCPNDPRGKGIDDDEKGKATTTASVLKPKLFF